MAHRCLHHGIIQQQRTHLAKAPQHRLPGQSICLARALHCTAKINTLKEEGGAGKHGKLPKFFFHLSIYSLILYLA